MALPSSDAAFNNLAVASALLFGVSLATVRGWIREYGPIYETGVIFGTLLLTNAFVLYVDDAPVAVDIPAAAAEDGVRRALIILWPLLMVIAGCVLGFVVVAVFRACVEACGRKRRKVPLVPGRRRDTACGWCILAEIVLFLASVWACLYCFPASDYYTWLLLR